MVIQQLLKFGRLMKLANKILQLFKKIKPRCLLSLDSQFYNLPQKTIVYRFKVFGEHICSNNIGIFRFVYFKKNKKNKFRQLKPVIRLF